MQYPVNTLFHDRLCLCAKYLLVCVAAIAVLILAGWQFDIELLKSWDQTTRYMNPVTAVLMLLSSLSVIPFVSRKGKEYFASASIIAAMLVLLIAAAVIVGYLTGQDFGIDLMLWHDKIAAGGTRFRMAAPTLTCFVLFPLTVFAMTVRKGHRAWTSHIALLPILLISMISLLSNLYQGIRISEAVFLVPMALSTSVCFLLLSLSVLFLTPQEGFMKQLTSTLPGSSIARVLIPAAVIVPALLGFLRIWGFQQGFYNYEFGIALLTVATIVIFFAIVWYSTVAINRRELDRLAVNQVLENREEQVRAIFDNAPDAIVIVGAEGKITQWNPQATRLFGWTPEEVSGKLLSEVIISPVGSAGPDEELRRIFLQYDPEATSRTRELKAVHRDQHPIDISLSMSPMIQDGESFMIAFMRNITERKRTEQKLKTFNEELSTQVLNKTREVTEIFERLTDGFIALDQDFRYTFLNRVAGQMIGLEPSSLIGKKVWEVFPDAVGSSTFQAFNTAMATQEFVSNTDYFESLDLWQENHIYPSSNGLSIFIRDISNQKRAEKIISDARNLADRLIDSLPGVFYFYDEQGNFLKWNKQFEKVTGYSADEIADMHPLQFFRESDHAYMSSRIGQVYENKVSDAEANFLTKRGELIPYYFKASLMNYNGKPCLLGTGIDITERKRAEADLKSSEQKYKMLFEKNPMPMMMVALPEYKLVDVNDSAQRKFRYSREEFGKIDLRSLRNVPEEFRAEIEIDTSMRGETQLGVLEMKDREGRIILMDIVTDDIFFQEKPVRLILFNDVTQEQISKDKLADSYESIRQLTEYLQNIREEERMHISREIHDELGQLLTVLKMDVSWLNKKIDAPEGPVRNKIAELLALIDTTVKTVRRIASELRPTLLDDLGLQAAMEWHLEEFERRSGIVHTFDPPASEIQIADNLKIGMFRILQESLTNVARHSGAKNVHVSLKQVDNDVILTVIDDGHGFDEEKTKKKTLGLLGMKERSNVMGGNYVLSSQPGKGTTVQVTVPVPVAKESVN